MTFLSIVGNVHCLQFEQNLCNHTTVHIILLSNVCVYIKGKKKKIKD